MPIVAMPPEFDLNYYRRTYPELNIFIDDVLTEHYKRYAVEQGHSTCIYDRREYLKELLSDLINKHHLKTLEISPFNRAFISGATVKYFATTDSDGLKKEALPIYGNADNVPAKIDFISPTGDLSVVDEKFDIVFSSHVIEHCPDLVEHFQAVSRILNPSGVYVLIVPDKRYCFDHYHSESMLSEVIEASVNKRKFPRLADVINQGFTRTHNNAILHWLGEHGERYGHRNAPFPDRLKVKILDEYFGDDGEDNRREKLLRLIEKYSEALERGEYISTHNWRFTPENFRYIVHMLNDLKFIDLRLYRCCNTVWGRQEFVAVLEKT